MLKKWLALLVKFAISAALIWFLFDRNHAKIDEAIESVRRIDPTMLVLAVLMMLVQVGICALRWRAVLIAIGEPLSLTKSALLFYIGAFFSQTLPSSVGGDAVRMYKARHAGLSLGAAINGVMLERAATVVALVVLVIATQPLFLPRVAPDSQHWTLVALTILTVGMVVGLALLMQFDRLPEKLRHWRIVQGLAYLAADTRRVFLSPRHCVNAVGWGVVGHVNLAMAIYFLILGMDIDATFVDCLALIPPVILVTTLPISIAGWGVRESAMVVAFGLVGVPEPSALALSILFGLIGVVTSLPGGLLWLLTREKTETIASPGA
jgi:glycosyltransferase 2 family protein